MKKGIYEHTELLNKPWEENYHKAEHHINYHKAEHHINYHKAERHIDVSLVFCIFVTIICIVQMFKNIKELLK